MKNDCFWWESCHSLAVVTCDVPVRHAQCAQVQLMYKSNDNFSSIFLFLLRCVALIDNTKETKIIHYNHDDDSANRNQSIAKWAKWAESVECSMLDVAMLTGVHEMSTHLP